MDDKHHLVIKNELINKCGSKNIIFEIDKCLNWNIWASDYWVFISYKLKVFIKFIFWLRESF